jgi:hypothetical protein
MDERREDPRPVWTGDFFGCSGIKSSSLLEKLHHSGSTVEFTLSRKLTSRDYNIRIGPGWAGRNPESLSAMIH